MGDTLRYILLCKTLRVDGTAGCVTPIKGLTIRSAEWHNYKKENDSDARLGVTIIKKRMTPTRDWATPFDLIAPIDCMALNE